MLIQIILWLENQWETWWVIAGHLNFALQQLSVQMEKTVIPTGRDSIQKADEVFVIGVVRRLMKCLTFVMSPIGSNRIVLL